MSIENEITRLSAAVENLCSLLAAGSLGVNTSAAVTPASQDPKPDPEKSDASNDQPPGNSSGDVTKKKRASKKTASKKKAAAKKQVEVVVEDSPVSEYDNIDVMKKEMGEIADQSGVPKAFDLLKKYVKDQGYAMISECPPSERVEFMDAFMFHFDTLAEEAASA